jgi:tetratricopeptide (TPR) repeat protein
MVVYLLTVLLAVAAWATPLPLEDSIQTLADRLAEAPPVERTALLEPLSPADAAALIALLHQRGRDLMDKGEYGKARAQTEAELAVARRFGTVQDKLNALTNHGLCLDRIGEPERALDFYREELSLAEANGLKESEADSLNQIGVSSEHVGRFEEARVALERSLSIQRERNDELGVARVLNNLALLHSRQGDLRKSAEIAQQCLKLSEKIHSQMGIAFSLNNLATTYMLMDQDQLAVEYLDRSLELKRKLGNKRDIASALQNLSVAHMHLSNYAKALAYADENLKLAREVGNPAYLADPLCNRGDILQLMGRTEDALHDLTEALELGRKYNDPGTICEAALQISQIRLDRSEFEAAQTQVRECLNVASAPGMAHWRRRALFIAGICHLKLHRAEEAIAAFEESVKMIDDARNQVIGGAQESESFLASKTEPYQALIGLYLNAKRYDDALAMAERIKARVLLDALHRGHVEVTKSMTASEKEHEQSLNARVATLNRDLLRQLPGSPGENAARTRLDDAQRQRKQLEVELYTAHPELRGQRAEFEPLTRAQMLALAPDNQTALLEFAVLHEAVVAFVLTRQGGELSLRVHETPLADVALTKAVDALHQQIVTRDLGYRSEAKRLYSVLLGPVEAELRGKKTVIIIPDAALWKLPFPALITPRGKHLIEEKTIFYAHSLGVLYAESQHPSAYPAGVLLAMGNPPASGEFAALPNAEEEVQQIGKLYAGPMTRATASCTWPRTEC